MTPQFIDFDALDAHLTEAANRYEATAPTVANYVNDLYVRLKERPATVVVPEILFAGRLLEEGVWMQPNYAANQLLHLLHRLGRDTSGVGDC